MQDKNRNALEVTRQFLDPLVGDERLNVEF
jgi:hypothetical protein